MTVDWAVVPGLPLLLAELMALAAVGYVVAHTVLRQSDERKAAPWPGRPTDPGSRAPCAGPEDLGDRADPARPTPQARCWSPAVVDAPPQAQHRQVFKGLQVRQVSSRERVVVAAVDPGDGFVVAGARSGGSDPRVAGCHELTDGPGGTSVPDRPELPVESHEGCPYRD